jgi:tetratricopeptide (TPR) repeat protein
MFKVFRQSDLPLSEGELADRRERQKKLLIIAGGIVVILILGYFSARPALNVVRAWQARRHADKAFAFIEQEKWNDARKEATAAYQLRSSEPQAIRAIARLLSRAGQADALNFWKQLATETTLTRSDLRDEASIALRSRELDVADNAIKKLVSDRGGGPTPSDWLLAADLAMQKQEFDTATSHLRRVFASTNASSRDQFQATIALDKIFATKEARDRTEIFSRLAALSRGKDSTGLDALVALGQQILAAQTAWKETAGVSVRQVIQGLETHPLAKPQHRLLAIDLKIHENPEQKETLTQQAIEQWKGGDHTALIALAAWLNAHGDHQLELDTISRQRAMENRDLFFQHVDALGALDRWDEIRRLIESEQFPLDPVVAHMYLARCFAQQNQMSGAENNWSRALEAAAGDPSKLMILADYAEKNGAFEVAGKAYEAVVAVAPKSRVGQQGRLRVAYALRNTPKIHEILIELLKLWPNDLAIQNDEAYARLLLLPFDSSTLHQRQSGSDQRQSGSDQPSISFDPSTTSELSSIQQLAEKLVEHNPTSLPHRTLLALALLKQNRGSEALSVYKDINVPKNALTTSSVAVHAGVLGATGHTEEAKTEFSHLPADKLLPEEKALEPK